VYRVEGIIHGARFVVKHRGEAPLPFQKRTVPSSLHTMPAAVEAHLIEILAGVSGVILGGIVAWWWAATRARAAAAAAVADLRATLGSRDGTIAELRNLVQAGSDEQRRLHSDLDQAHRGRTEAETRLEESRHAVEEQRRMLQAAEQRLKDTFAALSAEALRTNAAQFATQAEEKLTPLRSALERYERQISQMEAARQTAYGSVTEQLKNIQTAHEALNQQTANLVTALRAPQVRGRWGEITLRRVVEVAGMSTHCDFVEQQSVAAAEGRLRPDLVVTLPGGRTIVVDSKVPLTGYLDAVEAADETIRRDGLLRHARAVRTHMLSLSGKAYWEQFATTPDFVVLFLPGESFFSAALEQDRSLIEDGIQQRIVLATPTTLIALLRTVAYSWQQQQVTENAQRIAAAGRELFDRVGKFAEHLGKVGDGLRRATDAYNTAVGTWSTRILPSGRRLTELGATAADQRFPELDGVPLAPRPVPGDATEDERG